MAVFLESKFILFYEINISYYVSLNMYSEQEHTQKNQELT